MNLDVEKAEKALEYVKGYAKGYITEMECNEMMDIIQILKDNIFPILNLWISTEKQIKT